MIIRIEELQGVCSTILGVIDSSELSSLTETLELKAENNFLCLNVTNREYFVKVKIPLDESIEFHATVNAKLFLKLIAQTTTETVEFTIKDNNLEVTGNGKYKLPMIFDNDTVLNLPEIHINNETSNFDVNTEILHSILKYNSKELAKGVIKNPIQTLYYLDQKGCITFTSGACVNNFTLPQPITVLLNNRVVKLFKLLSEDKTHLTLGYDAISEDIIQTKLKLEDANVEITAILNCNDTLINSVPVDAIRGRAEDLYDYSVVIDKNYLIQAINRLLLFTSGYGSREILKPYSKFNFTKNQVIIHDASDINKETLNYHNSVDNLSEPYDAILDLAELKATLDACSEQYITIRFGNHQAITISRSNIVNIIPECHDVG